MAKEKATDNKDFWEYCEANLREVLSWPAWMRGGTVEPESAEKFEPNSDLPGYLAEIYYRPITLREGRNER